MGCVNSHDKTKVNPYFDADVKGYHKDELEKLLNYIGQTNQWLDDNGVVDTDVMMIRVGVPYCGSDQTVSADTVYKNDGLPTDDLIKVVGIDAIKITNKNKSRCYTYKSEYIHRIFGNYFVDGVDNRSGYGELDGVDTNLSGLKPLVLPGQTVVGVETISEDDIVYKTMTMLAQNPLMLRKITNSDEDERKGDVMYVSVARYKARMTEVIDMINTKINKFAPELYEEIKELLDNINMDQAFKDTRFGGTIDDLRVVIQVPASRANQDMLERVIHLTNDEIADGKTIGDKFNECFVETWITRSPKDVEQVGEEKRPHLEDVYSNELTDSDGLVWNIEDVSDGNYGCWKHTETTTETENEETGETETTTTITDEYRYWLVSKDWLDNATLEEISMVYWSGLDLVSSNNKPCEYDEAITFIIVVVMAIVTIMTAGATLEGLAYVLAVTGAVLSVALQMGMFKGATKRNVEILLILIAAYSSYEVVTSEAATTSQVVTESIKIAGLGVQVVGDIKEYEYQKDIQKLEDELEELDKEGAEMYESKLRFMYGNSYRYCVDSGPGSDPYAEVKKFYKKISVYDGDGFKS